MFRNILKIILCLFLFGILNAEDSSLDYEMMMTSDAFNRGDFAKAKEGYMKLYDQTKDISYIKQAALSAANIGDFQEATKLALFYQNTSKNTQDLPTSKILADSYIRSGDISKAISTLEAIKKQEDSLPIDNILGTLYLNQKEYQKAFPLLDHFYNETHTEDALSKLIAIYISQKDIDSATNLLRSHLENYGCSPDLCQKSIDMLLKTKGIAQAEKVFQDIFNKNPTPQNAQFLIWILTYQKKYQEAEKIAKSFPDNKKFLLELYVLQKKFSQAYNEAKIIYDETKESKYLALEAVYEFESLENPKKHQIQNIVDNLEKYVTQRDKEIKLTKENLNFQDAFFYNFLGYMLIDYDMDIKKGIQYVKVALEIDPGSISYVDSLAWGYYKLGNCQNAKKLISTIPSDQVNLEPELLDHYNKIQSCQ